MGRPGSGIKRIIRKYATQHEIIRFDRDTAAFIDGISQPLDSALEYINIHIQPLGNGDLIENLPEGQRQTDVKKGWTLETIRKKDQVIEGNAIFTVNAIQEWPESGHIECDLLRTGERDNIA